MTIWWCTGCGMEDTRSHNACPSCGSALQVSPVDWLEPPDIDNETVFELEPQPIERAAIIEGLLTHAIRHRWEGLTDLVVRDADADAVDVILDEVLGEETRVDGDDAIPVDDDIDLDGVPDEFEGSENGYTVLSDLYVATDRLQRHRDEADIADFLAATGSALATAQPFGVDEETWADIQSAARNLANAIESRPDSSDVEVELKALRNQLQLLV